MDLTEFEQAVRDRLKQLSPEERKIQSESNLKKMGQQQLSPEERKIAERRNQLSPEERKIQSDSNLKKMGQQQVDARNKKAQDYLDKSKANKMKSPAYKAGRTSAKVQRSFTEGAKKLGSDLVKSIKSDLKVGSKAIKKVAPKLAGVARASAPVQAALEVMRTARFLGDEDYRKENEKAYEELADKNTFQRAVEGGLGGMATILTQSKNLLDTAGANIRSRESGIAAEEGKRRLIAKGILDESGKPIRREPQEYSDFAKREIAKRQAIEAGEKAAVPTDDIRAMNQPTGNALSVEPVPTEAPDIEAAYKQIESGNVPKAIPVDEETLEPIKPQLDEGRMAALFRTTTGTSFNPKSKADMGRMEQLRSFVEEDPDKLNKSDTKIALDFYRTLK